MKRVLVAHQSTIPHYRVPFYEAVERRRPPSWSLHVVFDPDARRRRRVFSEPIDPEAFHFAIEPVRTFALRLGGRRLLYQTFVRRARDFDLLVLEDAFYNLSYPLARCLRRRGELLAWWGQGRDRSRPRHRGPKAALEGLKRLWARSADGFFAYTEGVRDELVAAGVAADRIFVLGNTLDIEAHRQLYEAHRPRRDELRRQQGWEDRHVLVYVGRLDARKQLDDLAESVARLRREDPAYLLVAVGPDRDGAAMRLRRRLGDEGFSYAGVLVAPEALAPVLTAADVYTLPGWIGLGPLLALAYELPPVVVDGPAHGPEREYLSPTNAVLVGPDADAGEYARRVAELFADRERLAALRAAAWPSIRHLTIEAMADRFIAGIDALLSRTEPTAA